MTKAARINWAQWHRWRDVDEYRQWHGRGSASKGYCPLYETDACCTFEDASIAKLDLQRAWPTLRPVEQRLLAAEAVGYKPQEIAQRLGTSRAVVDTTVYRARQRLREAVHG